MLGTTERLNSNSLEEGRDSGQGPALRTENYGALNDTISEVLKICLSPRLFLSVDMNVADLIDSDTARWKTEVLFLTNLT